MNTKKEFPRINKANTSHLYRLEVSTLYAKGEVDIEANSRAQAVSIARKAGFIVCSVNMIG